MILTGKVRAGARTLVSLIPNLTFFPLGRDEYSTVILL